MKPLVFWCRWHNARLRLHGRNPEAVWGELVFPTHTDPFHYELPTRTLIIGRDETARTIILDEKGVEITPP